MHNSYIIQYLFSAQPCLQPATPNQDIDLEGDEIGNPHLPNSTQAIITSYQFGCCGDITAWKAAVEPNGPSHMEGGHTIHFQVWRPSPTVESDGCYSLVGENRFTSITLTDKLVRETPEPTNIITVQPGDVLGYYSVHRQRLRAGIALSEDLDSEIVWYHTSEHTSEDPQIPEAEESCPLPVGAGPGRKLDSSTNQGPVISASLGMCMNMTVVKFMYRRAGYFQWRKTSVSLHQQ